MEKHTTCRGHMDLDVFVDLVDIIHGHFRNLISISRNGSCECGEGEDCCESKESRGAAHFGCGLVFEVCVYVRMCMRYVQGVTCRPHERYQEVVAQKINSKF